MRHIRLASTIRSYVAQVMKGAMPKVPGLGTTSDLGQLMLRIEPAVSTAAELTATMAALDLRIGRETDWPPTTARLPPGIVAGGIKASGLHHQASRPLPTSGDSPRLACQVLSGSATAGFITQGPHETAGQCPVPSL